jgi:Spy/CpxP family protein refolding chaperone
MKRKYMWMGVVTLILALGFAAVHARGHRGKRHHFAGPRFEALDLTQDQKDQLRSLRSEGQKQMIKLKADMQLAHLELKDLMQQRSPDQKKVDRVVDKMNAAHAKMTSSRVKQQLAVHKVLTEEQLQKLNEKPTGQRRGRGHFRGGRRGGGPGHGMGMGGEHQGALSQESGSQI